MSAPVIPADVAAAVRYLRGQAQEARISAEDLERVADLVDQANHLQAIADLVEMQARQVLALKRWARQAAAELNLDDPEPSGALARLLERIANGEIEGG